MMRKVVPTSATSLGHLEACGATTQDQVEGLGHVMQLGLALPEQDRAEDNARKNPVETGPELEPRPC